MSSGLHAGRSRFAMGPLLGAGTFGEVYLARMTSPNGIQQDVAVKLLNPGLHPKSQPVSRMRDEGHMLASLNHPAILTVKDFCVLEGRIGLVTEYVAGADLHDCIFDEDPIPTRALVQAIGAVADALQVAWETPSPSGGRMGLVHRDIKPVNIRLTTHGAVKLLDFGIAKSEDERRETATVERMAIGTPSYMAPEVHTYEVVEALPSRDVFALGCTLFEGLCRELFFEGLDAKAIVRICNKRERYQEWLSQRLPRIASQDARLVVLLSRMLRFEHTERPTAREVADTAAELGERLSGPTLRAWSQAHRWVAPQGKDGPWSNRSMDDQGTLASGSYPSPSPGRANETLAPLLDDEAPARGGANPTLIAPTGGTVIQLPPGARAATVHQVDGTTQVVVMPAAPEPTPRSRRRAMDVEGWLALGVAMVVLFGGWLMLVDAEGFSALLRGDVGRALARPASFVTGLAPGAQEAALDDVGAAGGGTPLLAAGRQWGALPGASVEQLAEIALDGATDVIVMRPGQPALALPPDGSVLVPPGTVDVRARFAPIGSHGRQLELEVGAGDQVRITCDARSELCARR